MRISPEIVEQVRSSADILDIVSGYVTLKKKGQNHFGICPFHTEKTPSFSVNLQKQIFHCFGCGAGGNVIAFIMRIENAQFIDAVQILARKLNITIPEKEAPSSEELRKKQALFDVTRFATKFFQKQMKGPEGQKARDYLGKRGFESEILDRFEIGYAPKGWDHLIKAALAGGINNQQLKAAGLIIANDKGGFYDRFRERVIFPIHDVTGAVVGFGGRDLGDRAGSPKYINSPETWIYKKSRILFGLFQNHGAIRDKDLAILVEGYTDVIALTQAGVGNVVATSGTALTPGQARLLRRYTANSVLLYDGDLAGANAALRGIDVLMHDGIQVRVAQLPVGSDPDSYVTKHGKSELLDQVELAQELIDFKIQAFAASHSLESPKNKADLVYLLAETVAGIPDEVTRSFYVQDIAKRLHIGEDLVSKAVSKNRGRGQGQGQRPPTKDQPKPKAQEGDRQRRYAERDILTIVIRHKQMLPGIYENLEIKEIQNPLVRGIISQAYEQFVDTGSLNPQLILDGVEDPALQEYIAAAMVEGEEPTEAESIRQWTNDCLRVIKLANLNKNIESCRTAMRSQGAEGGDPGESKELLAKYQKLKEKEQKLKSKLFIAGAD